MVLSLITWTKKTIKTLLLSVFSLYLFTVQAQDTGTSTQENTLAKPTNQVKFISEDEFMLAGKYYAGKANHSAVLLLHDCSYSAGNYDKLAQRLSSFGLHTLSLDLRGYGASTSDRFSHVNMKRNTKDINVYQIEFDILKSYWPSDVLSAYQYLRDKINNKSDIAVVSSGCTASQSILLAQKRRINSFVMITPILNYAEKEHYKNLIDIPIYFIASAHHVNTYQTTKELFEWNGDNHSVFQLVKGIRQGQSLLRSKKYLAHDIAAWLDDTLAKKKQ